jgi:hypothetical protein
MGASLFSGKFLNGRFREMTTSSAQLNRRRERAHPRMLRKTSRLEERGLGAEDLPFLTVSIQIIADRLTIM